MRALPLPLLTAAVLASASLLNAQDTKSKNKTPAPAPHPIIERTPARPLFKRGGEFSFSECQFPFRNRERAGELMIIQIRPVRGVYGV